MDEGNPRSLSDIHLIWYQRDDGYWNAECECGATICGVRDFERSASEAWHFLKTEEDRRLGNKCKSCAAKFPTPNPNRPGPFRFR